ncbi:hypothetical protein F0365_09160 [Nonlabens sp. Ci31]|jgi:hypothetical protein|uniref:hypothetical protein n=1 Tax=Nonlabens sp. Ci31 TaxID=2608253 RepID=UPI001463CD4A|nr:hypothetical protein [Nonlabens sp. Ci31]QJP34551.1 hypothetical protein F0365_09160 [Nonlabens sp. Ci31]
MKTFLNRLQKQNRISVQLAGISFAAETLDFLLYVASDYEPFISVGLGILLLAFLINAVMFLIVMANFFLGFVPFKEALFTIYILLLHIPIAVLYSYIALQFV